jgi:hypothetical protein
MADEKLTALTELTAFTGDEVFYVVEDDDGTPVSRRITIENIAAGLAARTELTGAFAPLSLARTVVLMPWAAKNSTTATFVIVASDAGPMIQFGTTVNGEIAWDIGLEPGTYTIGFTHNKDSDRGIYSVQLNDVAVGTVDGYNASTSTVMSQLTGVTVAAGVNEFSMKMLTKNASSTNFKGIIGSVVLARTGA